MIPLTLAEIATGTDGILRLPADVDAALPLGEATVIDGPVVTDSRLLGPGGLYVARVGEHADGHDYVSAAAQAGALAALVQREVPGVPIAQIVVSDTEIAFGLLAREVIEAAGQRLQVVAITGSSGKTSTKDLLAHVLSQFGPTVAAQESFNSEIGVPLTVCRITHETRYLVVEMGARGLGHLRYLATIAPPDISVVLNVGYAHASEFGSLEAVEQAKSELVAALGVGGLAVLNADDERVAAMAPLAWAEGADITWVSAAGAFVDPPEPSEPAQPYEDELPMSERVDVDAAQPHPGSHVWADHIVLDDAGRARFTMHADTAAASPTPTTDPQSADVRLQLVGAHHVGNALSATAVALRLGMPLTDVAAALSSAAPVSRWRMEVSQRPDGVTVVNDAYNANPDSMAAALRALAAMTPGQPNTANPAGGRRIAVLGTMLELGPGSDDLHAGVGRLAVELQIDALVVVGEGARALAAAAGERATWVATSQEAESLLADLLRPGDIALFKSSRDSGLRWLGERVAAAGGDGR